MSMINVSETKCWVVKSLMKDLAKDYNDVHLESCFGGYYLVFK